MIEVRSKGDWWVVKAYGSTVSRHRLKRRAVQRAKSEARDRGTQLRIQRSNGTIQDNRSY